MGADPSILGLILGESALDDPNDMEAMFSGFDNKTPLSKIKFAYLLLILASEAEVGADPSILCLSLGESALDDPDDMEAMGLLYSIECISELNTVSLRTLQPVCC